MEREPQPEILTELDRLEYVVLGALMHGRNPYQSVRNELIRSGHDATDEDVFDRLHEINGAGLIEAREGGYRVTVEGEARYRQLAASINPGS